MSHLYARFQWESRRRTRIVEIRSLEYTAVSKSESNRRGRPRIHNPELTPAEINAINRRKREAAGRVPFQGHLDPGPELEEFERQFEGI